MKFYFSTFLIFVVHFCFSQKTVADTFVIQKSQPQNEEDLIYTIALQMPEFRGGEMALYKFIRAHLMYPAAERDAGRQGRVIVAFTINKDGSLSDFAIKKGVSEALDAEALRVVKMIPGFVPGIQKGKAVRVAYVVPIEFKLQ